MPELPYSPKGLLLGLGLASAFARIFPPESRQSKDVLSLSRRRSEKRSRNAGHAEGPAQCPFFPKSRYFTRVVRMLPWQASYSMRSTLRIRCTPVTRWFDPRAHSAIKDSTPTEGCASPWCSTLICRRSSKSSMATSSPSPFPLSKGRVWRQRSSSAPVSRLRAASSIPTRSAKCATAPPTAAIRRSSRERCRTVRECSQGTAVRQFDVTCLHAIGAIVQAVRAEPDSVHSLTNTTVTGATAVLLRLVALGTHSCVGRAH